MTIKKLFRIFSIILFLSVSIFVGSILLKSPSHNRSWKTEYSRLPRVDLEGEIATIRNVRQFAYTADGGIQSVSYLDRTVDVAQLNSVWYGISHFYPYGLAHTFLSFGFDDGRYVVISIEARQEIGESYHPVNGLLREYELIYIVGLEPDIIGLRTHIRKERVLLYKVQIGTPRARELFHDMIQRINQIHEHPEFYNTLIDNCTTGIVKQAEVLTFFQKYLDYRVILPGYSDELAHEVGLIDNGLSLTKVRAKAQIDPTATNLDDTEFSIKIRRF